MTAPNTTPSADEQAANVAAGEARELAETKKPDWNCPAGLNAAIRITHGGYGPSDVNNGFPPHYLDDDIRALYVNPQETVDAIPPQYADLIAHAIQVAEGGGSDADQIDLLAPKTVDVNPQPTPTNGPTPAAQIVTIVPGTTPGPDGAPPVAEEHAAIPLAHVSRIDALLAVLKRDAGIAEHWAADEIHALLHAA